jgi:hypothetical protein
VLVGLTILFDLDTSQHRQQRDTRQNKDIHIGSDQGYLGCCRMKTRRASCCDQR